MFMGKILSTLSTKLDHKKEERYYIQKDILNFIINDIKNGEYLMIKGSNSTGLNKLAEILKKRRIKCFLVFFRA